MASIGIGIGIVKTSAKLLVLVLVLLRRFPKVLVLVLGRNFGIAHLCLKHMCRDIILIVVLHIHTSMSAVKKNCHLGKGLARHH